MLERIALIALASYRLAEALAVEYGPFRLFDRFRWAIGLRWAVVYNKEGNVQDEDEVAENALAEMVKCLRCASLLWAVGLALAVGWIIKIPLWQAALEGLAAAGLAVYLGTMTRGGIRWRLE